MLVFMVEDRNRVSDGLLVTHLKTTEIYSALFSAEYRVPVKSHEFAWVILKIKAFNQL